MCDIDFFKLYNDRYGHQGGDECLKQVAEILAARYGGEECAVILSRSDMKGAMPVAEAIRSDLKAAGIVHAASKVSKFVTVSIGVTNAVAAGLSIEGLIGGRSRSIALSS
ncbi:diguanylate cyclase [Microcoleus sp. N3A4]|uniref:diguanylate cyclase n=1 Tax=Microcoleus sp. N3A4 TaxID=3055379 RepID=UPI002FD412BB